MPPKQDKISDDPRVYIYGDTKLLMELRSAPYDPKKNVWVPDDKECYIAVEVKEEKGDKVVVQLPKGATKDFPKDKLVMMNPSKFVCCEDMANMTYLNDASVLATLRDRYANGLIYTYSGLFCVVINPFRRLPLYTEEVVGMYRGKRRQEVPPHLFSVADNAYQNMLIDHQNQSMLITGESGAGKTENTKKVISYFALVAALGGPKKAEEEKKITLEDQIVQTNPVLESFGNAKTVRNNNSSRFGKFIRIHFNTKGKLAGADIESYLLEKVRVVEQLPGMERGYHIFYQLLSSGLKEVTKMIMVNEDAHEYKFLEKGEKTIKNVDDKEEMLLTDEAFDVLGFTQDEKTNIYKLTGGLLHFGNIKFKSKPREEQAECDGTESADKMCYLYGLNSGELQKGLLKPRGKLNVEKANRALEEQIAESNVKIEESGRQIQELTSLKSRLETENSEIARQLEESESQCSQLARAKSMLNQQLEELKRQLEEETKAKNHLSHQLRAAQHDCDTLKVQLEEEQEGKAEIQRALSKANTEVTAWRAKYESDAIQRAEELEDAKKKLAARLQDAEEQVEAANAKCSSLEKAKNRLAGEVEDLMIDVERANGAAAQLEKKQRLVDKQIAEWKTKCEEIGAELETSTKEARAYANELYKLKGQYEETLEALESLKKENKALHDEIHELTDQLGEGGKSVHELEKAKKRLEVEKEELQTALEEAEGALEVEEGKVLRVQLELSQLKADIDRRLAEKDEEFENTRKNHQRALDALQTTLDVEAKGRNEAVRAKKKLEADVNEVEAALENATKANNEARKTINKLQNQIQEVQATIDDEQRAREEAREHLAMSERRSNMLTAELEELRNGLDQAERARKMTEAELVESSDRVGELSAQNASLAGHKRKLEGEIGTLQAELDEVMAEHRQTEEKAKKAIGDAARIAEDLRQEQEHTAHIEKTKKNLEASIKDLQRRLDEAEAVAMKGGKRQLQKLEARVRDLESELDTEQRRHQDTLKNLRKNERRLKELSFQADEDRKKEERMQEMVEKLQLKIKSYKRQVEEAEEQANVNLAKWRKTQHDLEDAQERAEMAESALGKMRAQHRSAPSKGGKQ
ncbi:PREDICTED: myosin-7-like [Branchiostoma belcheri]|uniref:Myosin-7-like n=1 Tax=Branchiostoma belcheri TaxID=7741 RepID=A0A6P4Z3P7_BRABE|nr:PREDICTED: myosin-7-like [Branchiostoma belcheri]